MPPESKHYSASFPNLPTLLICHYSQSSCQLNSFSYPASTFSLCCVQDQHDLLRSSNKSLASPLFFSPNHNPIRSHLHQPQRAIPSLTLNSMIITLAQFNPVEVYGKGCFFVSCIGSTPNALLFVVCLCHIEDGRKCWSKPCLRWVGAGIYRGTASTDGREYSEDEVCDAGAPVGVQAEVDGRDEKRFKTDRALRNKEEALMGDMSCMIMPAISYS